MPTTTLTDVDRALPRALVRLARAGAYACPAPDAPGRFHVFSARNAFAAPVATLAEAVVERAMVLGWLTVPATDGRFSLSRHGRRALKRARSESSAACQCPEPSKRRAQDLHARAAPDSPRAPQRVEGPLVWLRKRKDRSGQPLITQSQYEAGTRFAADYAKGQMQARVTASWSATAPCLRSSKPGSGVDISDAARAARDRFHVAMTAVGPEMGRLLTDVCCHDIGLESAERSRGWPVRSGKVVLDMGLTALARHYGFESAPPAREAGQAPARRTAARRWADPAFTPNLSRWESPQETTASRGADATASP